MTFSKFIETYKTGKGYDYDGAYGVQCVDLIKYYIRDVLGAKPQNAGDAKDYWTKRNSAYIKSLFIPLKDGAKAKRGDVFIRLSGENGHIGIVTRADDDLFYTFEQNAGGKHKITKNAHTYSDDYKFLRPINQDNIKANKPKVESGKTYTFTTEPYVYKNTKKEAYKICDVTELNSTEKARLKNGTKVKVLEVSTISKNVWIKFACYKKTAFALVYNYDKDKAYIK